MNTKGRRTWTHLMGGVLAEGNEEAGDKYKVKLSVLLYALVKAPFVLLS
jgi:hypothetical protein